MGAFFRCSVESPEHTTAAWHPSIRAPAPVAGSKSPKGVESHDMGLQRRSRAPGSFFSQHRGDKAMTTDKELAPPPHGPRRCSDSATCHTWRGVIQGALNASPEGDKELCGRPQTSMTYDGEGPWGSRT